MWDWECASEDMNSYQPNFVQEVHETSLSNSHSYAAKKYHCGSRIKLKHNILNNKWYLR